MHREEVMYEKPPIRKASTGFHMVRVPDRDFQMWKVEAEKDRRSVAEWVCVTLERLIERRRREESQEEG